MLVYLTLLLPLSVFAQSETCEVLRTDQSFYAYFPYSHSKTLRNVDTNTVSRTVRNNNLNLHLISYQNGQYGHYVSYYEQVQDTVKVNTTLVSVKTGYMECASISYRPKELSRMFVKTSEDPFNFGNDVSKTMNGSVTLKCRYQYCWSLNATSNEYAYECPFDFVVPASLSLKFTLTTTLLPEEQSNHNMCIYSNGFKNGTHDCWDTTVYSSSYLYKPLKTTLDYFRARVYNTDNTSTIYRTVIKPQYSRETYSQYSNYSNYYSVCDNSCKVLSIDE